MPFDQPEFTIPDIQPYREKISEIPFQGKNDFFFSKKNKQDRAMEILMGKKAGSNGKGMEFDGFSTAGK